MQLVLTLIDHCNTCLSSITSMLQHTGMELFDHATNVESVIQYQIASTLKIPAT